MHLAKRHLLLDCYYLFSSHKWELKQNRQLLVPYKKQFCPKALPASVCLWFSSGRLFASCSLRWAGRTEASIYWHHLLPIQPWMFIFCFSCGTISILKWFLHHAPKSWILQLNRFHHFPDCAGTVKVRQDSLTYCTEAQPSTTFITCQKLNRKETYRIWLALLVVFS